MMDAIVSSLDQAMFVFVVAVVDNPDLGVLQKQLLEVLKYLSFQETFQSLESEIYGIVFILVLTELLMNLDL